MPRKDWSRVDIMDTRYALVPEDVYLCRIAEILTKSTKAGDEFWEIHWEIADGVYAGHRRVKDTLWFHTPKVLPRAKLLFACIGWGVEGDINFLPEHCEGRYAHCQVVTDRDEWKDRKGNDHVKLRSVVAFAGYMPAIQPEAASQQSEYSGTGAADNAAPTADEVFGD